jgi:hypothetical protein
LRDYQTYREKSTTPRIWNKLIGLAITHFALGNQEEALSLWHQAVEDKPKIQDIQWLSEDTLWSQPLLDVAQQLINKTST